MKPALASTPAYLYFSFLCILSSANLDSELRKSIEKAMTCQYPKVPEGPVMAITPMRFTQVVVILHQKFSTPTCGRTSAKPVSVSDERTWPFCVFGTCMQGRCQCAANFAGPKCGSYTKKCWLMYCYLTSCHPVHQSLHCICDPTLYGTPVTSGIYWYNEGKSSKYVAPPTGWKDEPTDMIKLKSDTAIQMGGTNQKMGEGSPSKVSVQGSRRKPEGSLFQGPKFRAGIPQRGISINQETGRIGSGAPSGENTNGGGIGSKSKDATEKSDVEEALEELEDVSQALKLIPLRIDLLIIFSFSMWCLLRIYIT